MIKLSPRREKLTFNGPAARVLQFLIVIFFIVSIGACSSRVFKRETDTTGTFRTEATSVRFLLFFEMPYEPRLRAMELARDTWGDNLRVTRAWNWPDLGFFQFLNGLIIGVRGAVVEGEYGIPPNTPDGIAVFDNIKKAKGTVHSVDGSPLTPAEGVAK